MKREDVIHHVIRQGPQWVWAVGTVAVVLVHPGYIPASWFVGMAVAGAGLKTFETLRGRRRPDDAP